MANRFWVSPLEASFDSTYWSAVSGGDPGASIPDSTDFAYFNNSGLGNCLIDGTASVYGIELGSGYSGSIYLSGSCEVQKSLVLNGGHLRDGTINVYGDVCCNLGFGSFSIDHNASITFVGPNKQSLFSNGGILPHVEVRKLTSNQIKTFGDYPIYLSGDFYIHDGTFHTNGHDIITYGVIISPTPSIPYDVDFDWDLITETPAFISALYEEMWYSTNGVDWTKNSNYETWNLNTLGGNGSWYGCANSSTSWIFGGYIDGINSLIYSPDGINFNVCDASNILRYANAICSNGSIWVAGGYSDDTNSLAYSYDGNKWFGLGLNNILGEVYDVKWNGSYFVAGGVGSIYVAMMSFDGINWMPTAFSSSGFTSIISMVWDGGRWIAHTNSNSGKMAYSSDGSTWTTYSPVGQGIRYPISIAYSSGAVSPKYVLVGRSSSGGLNSIAFSMDASTWTSLGNSLESELDKVIWNGSKFVAVSSNASVNSVIYSNDGSNWTGLGTSILPYGAWALDYGSIIL